MISPAEIAKLAHRLGVGDRVIEKDYLSLRLQNLEQLELDRLTQFAHRFNKPKLHRATNIIVQLAETDAAEYEL